MSRSTAPIKGCLGVLLALSLGCTPHDRLKMKARMGNRRAMYEYGLDIWKHTTGREDEVTEALAWMTKAAEKGEPEAMYRLAMIATAGGQSADPNGLFWLRKGAEAGDRPSMVELANAYQYGYLGLPIDKAEARKWYDAAYKGQR